MNKHEHTNGKGDKQRDRQVSYETYAANWERAFQSKNQTRANPTQYFIYGLFDTEGQVRYVGSTENPSRRGYQHERHLKEGSHSNRCLQARYDAGARFTLGVLESIPARSRIGVNAVERHWNQKHKETSCSYSLSLHSLPVSVGGLGRIKVR